jgi:uncharacterized protein VirK/YbjX
MFMTRSSAVRGIDAARPNFIERVRILGGALLRPRETRRWLRFLETHPPLADAGVTPSAFLGKIHRPYLCTSLDCGARVDLLIRHYESLTRAGFGSLLRQAVSQPLTLCTFTGKSGVPYELRLSALEPACQDGEVLLRLWSRGVCIYTIAFVAIADYAEANLKVGGLHGMLAGSGDFGIKQVTRDLYGCRPKDLMVALVRDLGAGFGCRRLILVGNRNKIPPAGKRICRKSADYDRTWQELHATMRADGDWELSCISARQTEQMPASSGSPVMPSKRSVLVESIRVAVRANIAARRSSNRYLFAATLPSMASRQRLEKSHG